MSSSERMIIAFGAFVGGLGIGMLFAPTSGNRTRRVARVQSIIEAGEEAADNIKKAASEAVGKYAPDLLGDDEAWQDVFTRTMKDVEDEKH